MTTSLHDRSILKLVTPFLMLAPNLADAHAGIGAASGWAHGMLHPFSGLDHLCAMIAVGLWAKQMDGRAVWLVPLTFVSVMALGGLLGMNGVHIPYAESGILMSLLVLGVLIAAAIRLPLAASAATVGIFALCHGYAHGIEMPRNASGMSYALGFMLSTVTLHMAGIGMAALLAIAGRPQWLRLAGASIALFGGALYFSN